MIRRNRPRRSHLAELTRQQMERRRDAQTLSAGEIDNRIVRAILARVPEGGQLTTDDILRMDVPRGAITPQRVQHCIDLAREIDPAIATVEAFA